MTTKLVRDRIREAPGFVACDSDSWRQVYDEREHVALLLRKAHEELGELVEAVILGAPILILGEACDLLETVTTLAAIAGNATPEQIAETIAAKQNARGGFLGGLVWDHP